MAALDIITLDTATPQLEVPQTGDTYNAPRAIAIAPETLTGSAATTSLNITQTWNTTGTPTALKLNVTDTASDAASNLLDLQVGGTSQFQVNKAGVVKLNNSGTITWTNANDLLFFSGSGYQRIRAYSVWGSGYGSGLGDNGTPSPCAVHLASSFRLGWTSGALINLGTYDVFLQRDAAATLAQRDGTNAQTFRLYNTYTDASNYERGKFAWSSNVLQIGTEKAGTGTARALELQTDGTTRLTLDASGNLGIGATSPAGRLHVANTNAGGAQLLTLQATNTTQGNGTIRWQGSAGVNQAFIGSYVNTADTGNLEFGNSTTTNLTLTSGGNLGLGTSTFGTSAAKVLAIGSGTEPSTGPADTVQFYSVDRSAGNTIPGIRCEGTGVTDAAITNVTVTNKIAMKVNGTIYYLLATTSAA